MARGDMLTRIIRELRRDDERRYAGREGRRGEPTRVLPSVELRGRTVADDELRRRSHHRRVGVVVEASGDAESPRKEDGQGDLVELGRLPMRSAVEKPVLIPASVGALLRLEVSECAECRIAVTRIKQRGCDATEVSRPNQVIDVVAVVDGLAPWGGRRGDERARVRLVLETVEQRE